MKPSDVVRERLLAANVSAKELAETIGVERGTAQLMLRGKRGIHANHFAAVADLLGTTADDLIRQSTTTDRTHDHTSDERELIRLYRSTDEKGKDVFLGIARLIVAGVVRQVAGQVVQQPVDHPTTRDGQGQIPLRHVPSVTRESAPRRGARAGRKGYK